MDSIKYIGLDVHQSTISVAVLNADGKLVMQSVVATHAATLLDFLHGLRGTFQLLLVGSRTGAALRRFSLAVAPRFLWECLISRTVSWFPAPAASNPSCRFPAMGLPVCFTVKGYETAFAGWAFGDDHGRRSR